MVTEVLKLLRLITSCFSRTPDVSRMYLEHLDENIKESYEGRTNSNWLCALYAEDEDDFKTFHFNTVKLCLHNPLLQHYFYSFRALMSGFMKTVVNISTRPYHPYFTSISPNF